MKSLDTSVAVDHLRGAAPAVGLLHQLVEDDEQLVASEVVRFELLAGVRQDERDALEQFFEAITWHAVDETVARAAGTLALRHRRAFSGIDDADYVIAATALLLDAELLTVNIRHFPMLDGLRPAY
ncbi:MAG TPA: type II toxin-antitoxin system VapC family toxin [Acidimicrobiales bacterium]|nr:type II toxin-antitoxin system VapC family toxin [Acidimicrobiales bacterium]